MGINPVAKYQPSDCTSQTGTAYKTQIDANSVAAQRIAARFAPHAAAAPNMTVVIDAGSIFDGTTLWEFGQQATSTLSAPVAHPRIDRIVLDNVSGAIQVVAGAEAISPVPPAIPNGRSPIAQVALAVGMAEITNAQITDERNFAALATGGFGAQASIGSAATCDLGSILSRNVFISGTTTITSFGASANTQSPIYLLEFAGALTLKNGAALLLPGGKDITTGNNDTAMAEYLGAGNWRVRDYTRAAGSYGSAAALDAGTDPGELVQLDPEGKLPSVDASNLLNLPSTPGAYVALATLDANSSASLVFTGMDGTYDEYVFELSNIVATGGNLCLRTSADNGATFDAGSSSYTSLYTYANGSGINTYAGSPSYGIIPPGSVSLLNGTVKIARPGSSARKMFDLSTKAITQSGSTLTIANGVIYKAATAAINAIQFLVSAGNIASGRITMYGVKHA